MPHGSAWRAVAASTRCRGCTMGANVGQAVFNVAGLVVSYYFGPLAGALVATAGQALFPAGGNIKGLRAQDQGFPTSQAGLDIPLVIGTQKIAGNVILAGPLAEHKKTQNRKGGGGGRKG